MAAASSSLCNMGVPKAYFLFVVVLVAASGPIRGSAYDFDVGGKHGWVVPPSNNSRVYNQWASKNRFRVGDSLIFKYKKDSVMMVTEEEYDHCNSKQPIFFYNNGNTEVELDHAGTYYFISGLREHCQKGQKMILRVLSQSEGRGPSPPGNQTEAVSPNDDSSTALRSSKASGLGGLIVFLAAGSLFFFF